MMTQPPLYPSSRTPEEIIGVKNMAIFVDFYSIASSPTNKGEYPTKRLVREIGKDVLSSIADTLLQLRANGFYPDGVDKYNNIKWRTVLKSKVQIEMEKGLPFLIGKTRKELGAIANGKTIKSMP